jgi:deoxyribonuclease IV
MRKIGAHVSSAGGPTNAIKNIEKISGNCFQIFAGSPRMWSRSLYSKKEVQKFNELILEKHLDPFFIHSLYLVNLASDNPNILEKSYNALLTDLQNGDALKSSGVIVHIGSHQGRGFNSVKTQLITRIQDLLSQTSTTPLLLENSSGQKGKIGSLEEIEILLKEANNPRLRVCIDTAHLYEAGYDLNDKNKINNLTKELEKRNILKKITCLHINDSKTSLDSRHDQHANIGEGHITLSALEYFINHPKLKHLPLILEVPGKDNRGPDLHNIKLLSELVK